MGYGIHKAQVKLGLPPLPLVAAFHTCPTALSREKQAEVLDTISYRSYINGRFVEM